MKQFDIFAGDAESFDVSDADWVRVTISIDAECLSRFSERAASQGLSRGRFIGMHVMLTESLAERALSGPTTGVH